MPHSRCTASLQNVEKAQDVRVNIRARIFNTVTHPRLRSQMHNPVESVLGKEPLHADRVLQGQPQKAEVWQFTASCDYSRARGRFIDTELAKTRKLESGIVVVVYGINANYLI